MNAALEKTWFSDSCLVKLCAPPYKILELYCSKPDLHSPNMNRVLRLSSAHHILSHMAIYCGM